MVLVTVVGGLTGCGGATDVVTSEPDVPYVCDDAASCPDDPAAPVLQVTSVCYGGCASVSVLGLPDAVLYGDGRVVRSTRQLPDPRPALTTGGVSTERVAELVALAEQGGLTGGGRSLLPRPENVADGGGDVLTARLGGEVTTVESPFAYDSPLGPGPEPGSDEPGSDQTAQRTLLRRLAEALRGTSGTTPYPGDRVVLRAEPSPYETADAPAWTGPRLADLPVEDGARCAVLTGEPARGALAAVAQDAFPGVYTEGGGALLVQARPALPHEDTCADVAETVRTSTGG